MILAFSQVMNGQPTYFIEKVWQSILEQNGTPSAEYLQYQKAYKEKFGKYWDGTGDNWHEPVDAKLHTIRANRITKSGELSVKQWKQGDLIHPSINNRTPIYFQFAPVMEVKSTQKIFMTDHLGFEVTVDDKYLYGPEIATLAKNDGFYSYQDFKNYFITQMKDAEFSGQIVHWTDLKY